MRGDATRPGGGLEEPTIVSGGDDSISATPHPHPHPHLRRSHDPPAGVVPVPHGPEAGAEKGAFFGGDDETEERAILGYLTYPDDSYTPEGVYWADLPIMQRLRFVSNIDWNETKSELASIGHMMKKDPLSPVAWYFRNAVLPGAGLGLEGYVLFSIGNLEPLFKSTWPECWGSSGTQCNSAWISAVTYLEVVGIMFGQVFVGVIGDWVGRRWGLIQDATIMFVGLLMLIASWGLDLNGWVICYAWSLFIYGCGVGGEYPLTSCSAMEDSGRRDGLSTRDDRLHRGRKVTTAFLMQGWGQFLNQVILILLLLIFNAGRGDPPYPVTNVQWTYRISFALPAVGTLWLVYYRIWRMPDASRELRLAKRRSGVTGYDISSLRNTFSHFGGRLIATAGAWFANDVFFYGNKLFQGQFISVISSNPDSVMTKWIWNLANVGVSLVGYYLASFLIDNRMYGRKTMQMVGFAVCFITFAIPAFQYHFFTSTTGIRGFQAMYFLSSFFNQFGPNSVTFLVAGEVFPTSVRASAHGFSACIGKLGALVASVLYNYIDTQTKFYVVPWFGLAGMLVTWLFLPDTTGLDLKEQERRWAYIREGRGHEYRGVAIHPRHLSLWERFRGVGGEYDPKADYETKVADMRKEWESHMAARSEKEISGDSSADTSENVFSDQVDDYFRRTASKPRPVGGVTEKVAQENDETTTLGAGTGSEKGQSGTSGSAPRS